MNEHHRNSRFIVEEYGIYSCFAKEDPRRHEFVTTDQAFFPHGVQLRYNSNTPICDVAQALRQGHERFDRRVPVAEPFQHLLQLEKWTHQLGWQRHKRSKATKSRWHITSCEPA